MHFASMLKSTMDIVVVAMWWMFMYACMVGWRVLVWFVFLVCWTTPVMRPQERPSTRHFKPALPLPFMRRELMMRLGSYWYGRSLGAFGIPVQRLCGLPQTKRGSASSLARNALWLCLVTRRGSFPPGSGPVQ